MESSNPSGRGRGRERISDNDLQPSSTFMEAKKEDNYEKANTILTLSSQKERQPQETEASSSSTVEWETSLVVSVEQYWKEQAKRNEAHIHSQRVLIQELEQSIENQRVDNEIRNAFISEFELKCRESFAKSCEVMIENMCTVLSDVPTAVATNHMIHSVDQDILTDVVTSSNDQLCEIVIPGVFENENLKTENDNMKIKSTEDRSTVLSSNPVNEDEISQTDNGVEEKNEPPSQDIPSVKRENELCRKSVSTDEVQPLPMTKLLHSQEPKKSDSNAKTNSYIPAVPARRGQRTKKENDAAVEKWLMTNNFAADVKLEKKERKPNDGDRKQLTMKMESEQTPQKLRKAKVKSTNGKLLYFDGDTTSSDDGEHFTV